VSSADEHFETHLTWLAHAVDCVASARVVKARAIIYAANFDFLPGVGAFSMSTVAAYCRCRKSFLIEKPME
jgi:hypothetical protein